jgi:hypothetical protein
VRLPRGAIGALAALALIGCGEDDDPLPAACTSGVRATVQALAAAPSQVRLPGDTRISTCVDRARSDAEIQEVGAILTRVADELAGALPASDRAAIQLGYLIGAVREGGRTTGGIHEELIRRLEQTPGLDGAPPARRAAFRRGEAAGQSTG